MSLPRLLLLTDRRSCPRPLVEVVSDAVDAGARSVVLRERDLPAAERAALARALADVLAPVDGLLVLSGDAPPGGPPGGALHLPAAAPLPEPRPRLVGRSCHDPVEVAAAARERCDWVTVSPVRVTASKPGYGPALGPAGLAACCTSGVPVYALGGVGPGDVGWCVDAGAHGVAVMGGVMRAPDPGAVVAALLAELGPDRLPEDRLPRLEEPA